MSNKAAIILAAGASTRLGKPKQLLMLEGENLLERSLRMASRAGYSPVVIVLGSSAQLISERSRLTGSEVIVNEDWETGLSTSIKKGVQSLQNVDGAVIMTCDIPAVTVHHLQALGETGAITASSYQNKRGVPAYFPRSSFPDLLQLNGDKGAWELLQTAHTIDLPSGELDIDTVHDLRQALEKFSQSSDRDA